MPTRAAVRAELARRHLGEFVRQAWPVLNPGVPLEWAWYLDAICRHLEAAARGHPAARRLLICQPPNTLKSTVASVCWPAWVWTWWPGCRFLCAANDGPLATRDAMAMRELVRSRWYQDGFRPGWRLRADQDEKTWFGNTAGGHRISYSVSARVTGKKGDVLLVDDANDAKKVASATDRQAVVDWHDLAFSGRVTDERRSPEVVVGQRLHPGDLIGHLKRRGGWTELRLAEEFDPAARCVTPLWADPRAAPGELLRPARFGPAQVAERVGVLGSAGYQAQHNQDPRAAGGKFFDRAKARLVHAVPAGTVAVRFWDTAPTKGAASANTAGVLVGKTPLGRFLVADCTAGNWTPAERDAVMLQTAAADRHRRDLRVVRTYIERPGGFGAESVDAQVRLLAGYAVEPVPVGSSDGSKEDRARPLSAQWEVGNVDVLDGPWAEAYLAELDEFPGGRRVDRCLPAGVPVLTGRGWVGVERVTTDDRVLTRAGWRPVIWSGQTAASSDTVVIDCHAGCVLECTPNHPVYVVGRGFVDASDILPGDQVVTCQASELTQLSGMAPGGGGIPTPHGDTFECTFRADTTGDRRPCTAPSGSTPTGQSHCGTTSITATAIRSTTTSPTWSASRKPSTVGGNGIWARLVPNRSSAIWTECVRKRLNGIARRRAASGTASTPFVPPPLGSPSAWSAEIAGVISMPSGRTRCTAATGAVRRPGRTGSPLTTGDASGVSVSSWRPSRTSGFALTAVVAVRGGRRGVPVFNLSVEFNPEYFAAGVLVHNCDASAGAFNKLCGGGGFGAADLPDPAAGGPTELDRLAAAGAFR